MARPTTLKLSLTLLSFLCCSLHGGASTSAIANANATASIRFITTSCQTTSYPRVCVESLTRYSCQIQKSPRLLAMMALSVSVKSAKLTKLYVAKLSEHQRLAPREKNALKDCLEEVAESVDQLDNSVTELKNLIRARSNDLGRHMSNLQTWVSAALTDENTCMDGFDEWPSTVKIKPCIRDLKAHMDNVTQVTSNALALCNKLVKN